MNLDRTFCSGLRCGKADTCDRWTKNMIKEAEKIGLSLEGRRISVAQFADHDGKCKMYSPVEGQKNEKKHR